MSCRLSLVLRLFSFVWFRFRLSAFTGAAALRSIVLRSSICMRPDSHTQSPNNCLRPFFALISSFFLFFVSLKMSLFPSIFEPLPFLFVWRVRRTLLLPDGVILPCDHELDFWHQFI